MATVATPTYAGATAYAITLASLATSTVDAGRQSIVIDNTVIDAIDFTIGGKITTGTTPTANKQIEIWLAASYDGTSFAGGLGAADAAVTPVGSKNLMRQAEVITVTATSNITYNWCVPSVNAVFGSMVPPPKFVVFVTQNTAVALNATGTNHELKVNPITVSSA